MTIFVMLISMGMVKFSTKIDAEALNELRKLSEEQGRTISGLLSEAVKDYLKRRRLRDEVMQQFEESVAEHQELGKLLAK